MTFKLYIMRHAKSDWSSAETSDFDRPINGRGQESARLIGQWLVDNNKIPQHIVSSSALRAKQTTALVLTAFNEVVPENVIYDDILYLANLDSLLQCIQKYKSGLSSLMLVAHNPGLEELVHYLSNKAASTDNMINSMTTANVAVFEYPDNEFDVYSDKGKLVEFIRPSEIN